MYRSILSLPALAAAIGLLAQTEVHQVVVLSEGRYDYANGVQVVPVTLGSFDPSSGSYTEMVAVPYARFGNDVKVENELIYVSADSFLLKYDANTFALLDQEVVHGIRRLALWNDQVLITRGEAGGLSHYFEVRDKNTFDLLYAIEPSDGMPYTCEAVEVLGDKAYVSMNDGFNWPNYTNLVGIVDLQSQEFESSVDLGPDGYNPEHLMVWDGSVYAFNNKDYTGSSISRIDPASASLVGTTNVAFTSGCGTSTAADGKVYYMEYAVNALARYDLQSGQVLDTLNNGLSAYGVLGDPINSVMYVSTTDFTSTGTLCTTTYDGVILASTAIGVSCGKMALDVRLSAGVGSNEQQSLEIYPNPVSDAVVLRVNGAGERGVLAIADATGRLILAQRCTLGIAQRIDVSHLASGLYSVRIDGAPFGRFVKQ
ncbi:MAG: T9SS type A sorting domain-containing protein [Flavobacteriales bacterium]|nr:T9SS type A sorting domain-containing protein [Flavobacteriales bacterium]